jgi:hypothetical protein
MADFKPKDPNYICSFEITKNKNKDPNNKEHINRPDYVLIDSDKMNKKGEPFKKNFTVNEVWSEASGYKQDSGSLKITIKKTGSTGAATQTQGNDGFMDQF